MAEGQAEEQAVLTKEAILAADDIQTEKVPVPEWGGQVCVRALTVRDRCEVDDWYQAIPEKDRSFSAYRARITVLSMCDEAGGSRLFPGDLVVEAAALDAKSSKAFGRVAEAAMKLNGFNSEKAAEEAAEEAEGNS